MNISRYIHRGVIGGMGFPVLEAIIILMFMISIALVLLVMAGCSPQRVLVRDCQEMKDTPFKNCELVQKL